MAKDPRFNFYPDNYMGGTIGFTLEQHGAYIQLIILNFHLGPFTEQQALDHLSQLTRGNTAVYTGLWKFLLPKFETDGEKFWSARLMKEKQKSKVHSEKQSERIKKRWSKEKNEYGISSGNTVVLPVMEMELELEIEDKNKKESLSKIEVFESLFSDQRYITDLSMAHKGKDLKQAFEECWIYHSQTPTPPEHLWQWKQKLNTWLTIKRDNATPKNKQSTSDLAQAFANRVMQQNSGS